MSLLAAIAGFFCTEKSPRPGAHRSHPQTLSPQSGLFSVEAIEPRLLLSGDPLVFVAPDAPSNLTVRTDSSAAPLVQIIDNQTGNILLSRELFDTSEVSVIGSEHDDTLTV